MYTLYRVLQQVRIGFLLFYFYSSPHTVFLCLLLLSFARANYEGTKKRGIVSERERERVSMRREPVFGGSGNHRTGFPYY